MVKGDKKKRKHVAIKKKKVFSKKLPEISRDEMDEFEELQKIPDQRVRGMTKLAKVLGVSIRTVQRWKREGMPGLDFGMYDVVAVRAWMLANKNKKQDKTAEDGWTEIYRKMKALLAELEYKKKLGELLSREEVERVEIRKILVVKNSLLGIPKIMAPQLVGLDAKDIYQRLRERVEQIIDDFAGAQKDSFEQKKKTLPEKNINKLAG